MSSSELIKALQELAHERKIDEFYLIERLEESLANSYQRILNLEWDPRVTIDRQSGKIYVYELVPVGEPDEETGEYEQFEERDVTPEDVSRIAAQNAKSVIAAIVLAASRTLGETIAVIMVCGNLAIVPGSLLDACYPIPALIANNYGEMLSLPLYESALMFAAFILFFVVLVFNLFSRLVLRRMQNN